MEKKLDRLFIEDPQQLSETSDTKEELDKLFIEESEEPYQKRSLDIVFLQETQQKRSSDLSLSSIIEDFKVKPDKELRQKNTSLSTHSESFHIEKPQNKANTALIEHLDLYQFKTKSCQINNFHLHKTCPYYHNSDLCEAVENGTICRKGDLCEKSHNYLEQLYHIDKYKTKFCSIYPKDDKFCEYGKFCSFAHSQQDIKIELIHLYELDEDFYIFHFKTVWCPFNYYVNHDKAMCPYAHNWQDYRRKPHKCYYSDKQCPNWNMNDFISSYENGCPERMNCKKAHGWKESEYHPLNYKTRTCMNKGICPRGRECPFYHSDDKRVINNDKFFQFYPKNKTATTNKSISFVSPRNSSGDERSFLSFLEGKKSNIKRGSLQEKMIEKKKNFSFQKILPKSNTQPPPGFHEVEKEREKEKEYYNLAQDIKKFSTG